MVPRHQDRPPHAQQMPSHVCPMQWIDLGEAKQRKEARCRGSFDPAVYILETLSFSTCGGICIMDTTFLCEKLAHNRVMRRNERANEGELAAAHGQKMGRFREGCPPFTNEPSLNARIFTSPRRGQQRPSDPTVTLAAARSNSNSSGNGPRGETEELRLVQGRQH